MTPKWLILPEDWVPIFTTPSVSMTSVGKFLSGWTQPEEILIFFQEQIKLRLVHSFKM